MKNIPTVIILLCLLVACRNEKSETIVNKNDFFDVNMHKDFNKNKKLKLSSLADSLTYIPLETKPNCLISEIKDIKINENYIFIITKNKELLVFLRSGKFYSKIGRRGKGPKEYYNVIHFDVGNEYAYILDYAQRIAQYKITGEFIKYISLPKQASRIMLLENNNIVCYIPDSMFEEDEPAYSFIVVDQEGHLEETIQSTILRNPSDKISNHYALTNFSNQHAITIKEAFNDTLFYLDTLSLNVHGFAFLDLGAHKIDFSKSYEQVVRAPHNMRINKLVHTGSFLFIYYACQCKGNKTVHLSVYNKRTKSFFNVVDQNQEKKIVNDIDSGPNLQPACVFKNELIAQINAFECVNHKALMDRFNQKIDIDDNPIIVIAKLKEQKAKL